MASHARRAQPGGLLGLYAVFWRFAEGKRASIALATVLLLGAQIVRLAVPWLAAQAINAIQRSGGENLHHAFWLIGAIILTTVLAWALHGPGRIAERSVGVAVRRNVADRLYDRVVRLPLSWHETNHSGETIHRLLKTSSALFDFAQNQFVYLQSFVNLTGPIIALSILSLSFGATAAFLYGVAGAVILSFDTRIMKLAQQQNAAERRYVATLSDFLANVSTLICLRLEAATRRLVGQRLSAVFAPLERMIVLNEAKWCAVDLVTVTLCWVLVGLYAWRNAGPGSTLLIGNVFMVYQYAGQAGSVMGALAGHYQQLARIRADFRSADPIWQATRRLASGTDLPRNWREIQIKGLDFTYPGCTDWRGLADAALTLRRGERIALVGPSGGGKSTLMRILGGLYSPDRIHMSIDGNRQIGARTLQQISTLIPQETVVFHGSVRDNATCGTPCEEPLLRRALRIARFDGVLEDLPNGLETLIAEDGVNLSGGQRQRLSLARGILAARDSSVIFLDEPTSSLDALTEANVFDELHAAFPDACIVASVHRLTLLARFDRVVLVAHGRVVDSGTPAELLARQPLFAQLWQAPAEAAVLRSERLIAAAA